MMSQIRGRGRRGYMTTCPNCKLDKATAYETAAKMLESTDYDVVILDIMGVRGFDLLDVAVKKNLRVAMLTAHALSRRL